MWTPKTREADLGFVSGFVTGDGSFYIRPNNGGASWCCGFAVKLRADDTPLLIAFRDWFGLGELSEAPARGRSHPQTAWLVARRDDCVRLATLLREFPPLGKAAPQFDLWCRAVELWAAAGGASPALARYAQRLRALHRSATPVPCPVDIKPAQRLRFLAGFASAEAHFGTTREGSPAFVINVRADDGPLLRCFRDLLDVGSLKDVPATPRSQAAVSWRVGRLADLRVLVDALDSVPPRGRAGHVYVAWRELVLLERRTGAARAALAADIRRRRTYRPELSRFPATTGRDRSRQRCLDALKWWAESRETPGSAVDYAVWRREVEPRPPTRNTIARVFGSWSNALKAAGISRERAMSAERVAAICAGGAARRKARHGELRELVVAAVRRCSAELGREPRALEFLRWRHQHSADCPSQMTIYRVFPGGFSEVLAAAGS